jgi:segregation and condensation protein B
VTTDPAREPDPEATPDTAPDPDRELRRAIEAVVLAATEPVETAVLAQLLEVAASRVDELCRALQAAYEAEDRGFVLARVAGGWRYQTHTDLAPYVERAVLEGQQARLSAAALETLGIIAYKQPVSRAQLAAIRGVSVDGVLRTLAQRGYVTEIARDPGPGQAVLYGTTRAFLEQLGLDGLHDLPSLGDFVPPAEVMDILEQSLRPEPVPVDAMAGGEPGAGAGADDAGRDGGPGGAPGPDA